MIFIIPGAFFRNLTLSKSPISKCYFSNFQCSTFQISQLFQFPTLRFPNFEFSKFRIPKSFQTFPNIRSPDAHKIVCRKCVHIFLYVLKYFGMFKFINKGSQGSINSEIMEMLGFGPSHNEIEILLDQN